MVANGLLPAPQQPAQAPQHPGSHPAAVGGERGAITGMGEEGGRQGQ